MQDKDRDEVLRLYHEGLSGNKISQVTGLPTATVYRLLRKEKLPCQKIQHNRDKEVVSKVLEAYKNGDSGPTIAKSLGCNPSTISRIIKRADVAARPLSPYTINENFFDEIDTEEKAYTLGFFTADGCLTRDGVMSIKIIDLDVIQKIKVAMNHNSPIRTVLPKPNKPHHKILYKLEVGRKQLAASLTKWGCGPAKSLTTTFPINIPPHLYRHFIRGLFDGDGSIPISKSKQKIISFRIAGTAALLGGVLDVLRKELNVGGGIYPHVKIFYLDFSGKHQIKDILDYLYKDATIYMDRKYAIYQKFIGE